jgi:hypothetical protein
MIKIVVAGAENNATFRNFRNEKILTVSKNTHSGWMPARQGFPAVLKRILGDRRVLEKFRAESDIRIGIFSSDIRLHANQITNSFLDA